MTKVEKIQALFVDDVETRKKAIRAFVMDQSNSYEDRYKIWKECPEHLAHHEHWIIDLTNFEKKYGEIDWYSDFYKDRYQDVDLTDVFSYVDWPEEKQRDFIEECMDNGYWTFNFDW